MNPSNAESVKSFIDSPETLKKLDQIRYKFDLMTASWNHFMHTLIASNADSAIDHLMRIADQMQRAFKGWQYMFQIVSTVPGSKEQNEVWRNINQDTAREKAYYKKMGWEWDEDEDTDTGSTGSKGPNGETHAQYLARQAKIFTDLQARRQQELNQAPPSSPASIVTNQNIDNKNNLSVNFGNVSEGDLPLMNKFSKQMISDYQKAMSERDAQMIANSMSNRTGG